MIVGTAGHIDHGKTALVRALTGVETDRLKEEKARGITIELGFAYLAEASRSIGFVDVPGHERFVHTMLAGASGIDFALLVVAADDGPMPQTLEHLAILDLLGLRRGVVALSKADLADPARRDAVTAEIRALLAPTSLAGAEILPVSTVTGEGLDRLRDMLWQAAADTASRGETGAFRLAVDRSFILSGTGTVVTGTVLSGAVAVGDTVVVSPTGLPARIRSIHAQNQPAERGVAGQRCALNLTGEGISRDVVSRGDMILDPALHAPTTRIDARLCLLDSEPKPVGGLLTARLHHASAEVGVRLVPLEGAIPPGGQGRIQLMLERPIAAAVGDRFILRDASAQRTIGGGRFLDLRGPARKRRTAERLEQLDAAAQTEPAEALRRLLTLPPFHVELSDFVRDRALSAAEGEALAALPGLTGIRAGDLHVLMAQDRWQAFQASLLAELARFHEENPDLQGTGRERLRMLLQPRLPMPVFRAVLEEEARVGRLVLEGAFLRLPGHEVRLGPEDEDLFARIAPLIGGPHRFRPPRVRDLVPMVCAEEAQIRRLMKLCTRLGRVDQIAHDHFFLRATTAEMVEIAHDVAARSPDGTITAAAFRNRMDNGRKVAIQILDFLDRHGVTLRRGDLRRINPHRNDLFRTYAGEVPPVGGMNGPASPPRPEPKMTIPP